MCRRWAAFIFAALLFGRGMSRAELVGYTENQRLTAFGTRVKFCGRSELSIASSGAGWYNTGERWDSDETVGDIRSGRHFV